MHRQTTNPKLEENIMKHNARVRLLAVCLTLWAALLPSLVIAQSSRGAPGTDPIQRRYSKAMRIASVTPFTTETGLVSLSLDGLGSNAASGTIQVEKPSGAVVRKAYMAAASTGFSGRVLANGDVKINGVDVVWNVVASTPSSISSFNSLADVTSIVKPTIDAAPAGTVNFTITEVNTSGIDGEILAVIFDDPNQVVSNTIVLLFGAQNIAGDQFSIGLANPINLSDPNLRLDFSLGISFGFQGTGQFSLVDVNSQRLTSSAGGQDDGIGANGALLTVGGLGDSNNNPPPNDPPNGNPRFDDELYNLIPFVTNGTTQINVNTVNPSNDDNIFFAALFLGSQTAVVGEGILLSPVADTNTVGQQHTVTARVQNNQGQPIPNRSVTIRVKGGPHVGLLATGNTNTNGEFSLTYTGTTAGRDTLIARMINSQGLPDSSNIATKLWVTGGPQPDLTPPSCDITAIIPGPPRQIQVTVRDVQSGLNTVTIVTSDNADVSIPSFTVGTTDPLVITATKVNQSLPSTVVLRVRDVAGNETVCDPVYTTISAEMPQQFALGANYPNPFNPSTRINFSVAKTDANTVVTLKVHDVIGREVKTLVSEPMQPGTYFVEWDGTNDKGIAVTSGVYIVRMLAGDFVASRRMVLMK